MGKKKKKAEDTREGLRKWRNSGRSTMGCWIDGKYILIKPKKEFKALESEVPQAFRDIIECISDVVAGPVVDSEDGKEILFRVIPNGDLFDVVNKEGDVQNDEPLDDAKAATLLAELTEE